MPKANPTALKPRGSHPALAGTPPGVFNPAAVGHVRGYPKTPEAHARQLVQLAANRDSARAAGLLNRKGVPNGYAGRRPEVEAIRLQAADGGWTAVAEWQRNSQTAEERLPDGRIEALKAGQVHARTDAEMFAVAAAYLISVVLDPTQPQRQRLQSAKAILPFLQAPPSGKARGEGVQDGIAWLAGLAGGGATAA